MKRVSLLARTLVPALLGVMVLAPHLLGQGSPERTPSKGQWRQFVPEAYQPFLRAQIRRSRHLGAPLVVVPESESNNSSGTADAASIGDQVTGEINPAGDVDYFVFLASAGAVLEIDVDASETGSPLDPTLELFDTDGVTSLAFNDDFFSLDSRIRYAIAVTGDYFIAIRGFAGQGGPGFVYSINLATLPPGPGDPATVFASGLQLPWVMVFDSEGNLFVVDQFTEQITRVSAAGAVSVFSSAVPFPTGLTFDAFGNLLVASGDGVVYQVTPSTLSPFITDVEFPGSITLGPDGSIWVADFGTGSLRRYDPYGTFRESFSTGPAAFALVFAPTGELHFSDFSAIYKLVNGQVQLVVQASSFCCIEGIAIDIAGNVYAGNSLEGKITLYAPDGSVLNDPFAYINTGVPIALAFVREPDGSAAARLVATSVAFGQFGPPTGSILELNPAGVAVPGYLVTVTNLLHISKNDLRSGTMGADYADTLAVSNLGVTPTWSVAEGALPPGLTLDGSTGVVSGIPSETGVFTFLVRAEAAALAGERFYTILVVAPTLVAADVADAVLGVGGLLSESELRYVDLLGNRNGMLDIGDFRAFLQATGVIPAIQAAHP